MAGARALWRANGMTDADFGKPIIAIVNSAIAAFYYLNIVRYMFFMPAPAAQANEIAAPTALRVLLWICAAMTLAIGLVAQPFIDWATRSAVLLAAAL